MSVGSERELSKKDSVETAAPCDELVGVPLEVRIHQSIEKRAGFGKVRQD